MRSKLHTLFCVFIAFLPAASAAPKPHVISFGKWTSVKYMGVVERDPLDLKIRPLYVDARLKEYTTGPSHEVTDRLFVVQRVFRLNDSLPEESGGAPRWQWQRGGWLLVDRLTGHVAQVPLPDFDPFYSMSSWYRDYVAYCGISEDGRKLFAMVAQLGRRKPILRKPAGEVKLGDASDPVYSPPVWQRAPTRVSFGSGQGEKITYAVKGQAVDLVNDEEDEEAASAN
jgi:hypothetical protein